MEGMSTQAQQIWSMLDDMAENNPAAYRKFIDKQLKNGKEQMALPDPHMCIKVVLIKPHKPLFVNFCAWSRLPEPKSAQDAVPISGTIITHEKDEKGNYALTSVAFNPNVLKEYGRHAHHPVDADTLIQLALDYIEHEQKVKVSRSYTVLSEDTPHKGDLKLVQMSFMKLPNQKMGKSENGKSHSSESHSQNPDSMLSKLSNISVGGSADAQTEARNGAEVLPSINIFGDQIDQKPKQSLIEELKTPKQPTPKYSLEPSEIDLSRVFILKVDLPDLGSVKECQLDISKDDIELTVPGRYELKLKLPSDIKDDEAIAKFSKKLSTLTVTMPIKS